MGADRRSIWRASIGLVLVVLAPKSPVTLARAEEGGRIAVLTGSGVPAYRLAVEGIQAEVVRTTGRQATVFELATANNEATLQHLRSANPAVVISVGIRATAAAAESGLPYVATMLLAEEATQISPAGALLASVTLDVTPRAALTQIRRAFPRWRRIAVVRGPNHTGPSMVEIEAQAAALGFSLLPVECDGPKALLAVPAKLRGRIDVIWCLPNRELYEPTAVQALILSSIRLGVPLIGFSEGFLRAGALVAVVPDYRDVGRQGAELIRQGRSGGRTPVRQSVRTVRSMVNERVGRAMGTDLSGVSAEVERIR